jgi:hypothetical protein
MRIFLKDSDSVKGSFGPKDHEALALVLCAWDHQLGRPQCLLFQSRLSCCDHKAKFIFGNVGLEHQASALVISLDWPWRGDAEHLALGEMYQSTTIDAEPGNLIDYLNIWEADKRDRNRG